MRSNLKIRKASRSRGQNNRYAVDPDVWCAHGESLGKGAAELFRSANPFLWFPASLLGHQALEILLKAALLRRGAKITKDGVWGHDLLKLANQLKAEEPSLHEFVLRAARTFNAFFEELRYPGELNKVQGLGESDGEDLRDAIQYVLPYARAPKSPLPIAERSECGVC